MADRNGYIGRAPADSAVTVARQTFSPTGVTTDFTFTSGYNVGYFDLFINGVKMIEGSDYTSTDGSTFTILNGGAQNGDVIEGVAYKAFNAASAVIGINSSGTSIGNVNSLNFIGAGNTFALRGNSIDISIEATGSTGTAGTFSVNSTGIHTTKNVGIGTTTATGAADTNNTTILNAGIVTANNFYGAFTGNVTGDVTGNADTATNAVVSQGLTGSPNITVSTISATNITASGTLTYEDVTNVDSIGLVTARSGIEFGASGVGGTITAAGNAEFAGLITARNGISVLGAGITVTGISTFYTEVNVGTAVTLDATSGIVSATSFYGDGANLTGLPASGVEIESGGSSLGAGVTIINFSGDALVVTASGAGSTVTIGVSTEAFTSSGIVTAVRLGTAQDHKITATGFTTITSSGSGTEGESHTIRIINSGIATVGFSTYFLFPSGSAPSLPTADGAISLISFTVHDSVGAGCTQLLAGASVNYS